MAAPLVIGWLSTGRGEGSRGLLRLVQSNIASGDINASITFVFSNREPGEAEGSDRFFQDVKGYGIPLVTFSSRRFREQVGNFAAHRLEYDREVMQRLAGYAPELCVLAGYMLIAGSEMCRKYTLVNLHPALPTGPIGTWQEVIWKLIETRSPETGAMIHLATEDVDRGPVLTYFSLPLTGAPFTQGWQEIGGRPVGEIKAKYGEELPLFKLIRQEEYRREPLLLVETLKALATGVIRIRGQRLVDASGKQITGGHCLDREIEVALQGRSP